MAAGPLSGLCIEPRVKLTDEPFGALDLLPLSDPRQSLPRHDAPILLSPAVRTDEKVVAAPSGLLDTLMP
ncbi:hypothetical protein GCM10010990_09610 [Croceicoccus mobilis]|uniref:Uncharacterized protein n=1 Tax=Croceicoccus mobilis TaxID=1703339 RepID=A0A916YVA8_9SPHN|nr:hypothetical protein GCM10010990_09610 [Croceicoccus mobilis]